MVWVAFSRSWDNRVFEIDIVAYFNSTTALRACQIQKIFNCIQILYTRRWYMAIAAHTRSVINLKPAASRFSVVVFR